MPSHAFSFRRHALAAACAALALTVGPVGWAADGSAAGQTPNAAGAANAAAAATSPGSAGSVDKGASIKPERVRIDVSKAEVGVPTPAVKNDASATGTVSLPAKAPAPIDAHLPAPTKVQGSAEAPTASATVQRHAAAAQTTTKAAVQTDAVAPAPAKAAAPAAAAAAAASPAASAAAEAPPAGSMEAVVERLQQRLGASRGANGAVKVVTRQPGDLEMSVPERPPQRRARPAQHASRATAQRGSRAPEHGSVALAAAHGGGSVRTHESAAGAAGAAKAHDKPAAHAADAAHGTHAGAAHWSYEGEHGPAAWGAMKPEFATCATGSRQSPIDIRGGVAVDLEPIKFDYRSTNFGVVDNGHTIQVNVGAGNSIEVMGRRYELAQFHFHRPSEERIDGRQFDMVAHLVHKSLEGQLAVVAVLLERGAAFAQIQQVWNNLPLEKNTEQRALQPLDLNQLLPAERRYYTYMGSLTTPPCSEGVLWMVMQQPLSLSPQQLDAFARIYPMNARPLQANAGRLIKQSN